MVINVPDLSEELTEEVISNAFVKAENDPTEWDTCNYSFRGFCR